MLCGRCHPAPQGEELFRVDGYGVGDPLPPIGISVIEPCVQGRQKSNRLIGSIGSIV